MKKAALLTGLCLILSLSACSGTLEGTVGADGLAQTAGASALSAGLTAEPNPMENDGLPYGQPVDFDGKNLPAACADVIREYCRSGMFPDGRDGGEIPGRIFTPCLT